MLQSFCCVLFCFVVVLFFGSFLLLALLFGVIKMCCVRSENDMRTLVQPPRACVIE